jgi:hypothetical protein
MIYGSEIESIATSTRSIVKGGNNTFIKEFKAKQRIYQNKIKKLIEDFESRDK